MIGVQKVLRLQQVCWLPKYWTIWIIANLKWAIIFHTHKKNWVNFIRSTLFNRILKLCVDAKKRRQWIICFSHLDKCIEAFKAFCVFIFSLVVVDLHFCHSDSWFACDGDFNGNVHTGFAISLHYFAIARLTWQPNISSSFSRACARPRRFTHISQWWENTGKMHESQNWCGDRTHTDRTGKKEIERKVRFFEWPKLNKFHCLSAMCLMHEAIYVHTHTLFTV